MSIRILIMWYFTAPKRCIEICQHQHGQYTHKRIHINSIPEPFFMGFYSLYGVKPKNKNKKQQCKTIRTQKTSKCLNKIRICTAKAYIEEFMLPLSERNASFVFLILMKWIKWKFPYSIELRTELELKLH